MINTIVVKDLSRLGRNYIEVGKYIEEIFPEKGIRFIAIGDNFDTEKDNPDSDFMTAFKNIFNQFYPADCSRKTRQALKNKAEKGEFLGSVAAYGYKKSVADKHILEIDEDTAPIIERIFRMAAYENCGCTKIAKILTAEKVLKPSSYAAKAAGRAYAENPYEWNMTTVAKIIENQVYLGHTINGKKHKPSYKSKKVIKQSKDKHIIVENTEPHMFSGLVKCDTCGYALSLSSKIGKPPTLTCSKYKKDTSSCTIHFIRCKDLYDFVLYDIKRQSNLILKDEKKAAEKLKKKMCSTNKAALERIRSIKLESAEADENIENYIALIKEFKDIDELDKAVLHRLIDKITVSTKYEVDGVKKQNNELRRTFFRMYAVFHFINYAKKLCRQNFRSRKIVRLYAVS